MRTKMPADLMPGDKIAVEGGGYVVVTKVVEVEVSTGIAARLFGGPSSFPAMQVHWEGGTQPQVADPRTPIEVVG